MGAAIANELLGMVGAVSFDRLQSQRLQSCACRGGQLGVAKQSIFVCPTRWPGSPSHRPRPSEATGFNMDPFQDSRPSVSVVDAVENASGPHPASPGGRQGGRPSSVVIDCPVRSGLGKVACKEIPPGHCVIGVACCCSLTAVRRHFDGVWVAPRSRASGGRSCFPMVV